MLCMAGFANQLPDTAAKDVQIVNIVDQINNCTDKSRTLLLNPTNISRYLYNYQKKLLFTIHAAGFFRNRMEYFEVGKTWGNIEDLS